MGCGSSTAGGPSHPLHIRDGHDGFKGRSAPSRKDSTFAPETMIENQDSFRDKARLLLENDQFWDDEAFQDLSAMGEPPKDLAVLELLLDDYADTRMQRAAVNVYTEDAVQEWGEEVLDMSQALPIVGAVFGLMASIINKKIGPLGEQVNRNNCKLMQETVRSAARAVVTVLRKLPTHELASKHVHVKELVMDMIKALKAIRGLLTNYTNPTLWVLLMPISLQDKGRFEALHGFLEYTVQQVLARVSSTLWRAPMCDYVLGMEQAVMMAHKTTGIQDIKQCLGFIMERSDMLKQYAAATRLKPEYVVAAISESLPQLVVSTTGLPDKSRHAKQVAMMQRAKEAQATFESIKAAGQLTRSNSRGLQRSGSQNERQQPVLQRSPSNGRGNVAGPSPTSSPTLQRQWSNRQQQSAPASPMQRSAPNTPERSFQPLQLQSSTGFNRVQHTTAPPVASRLGAGAGMGRGGPQYPNAPQTIPEDDGGNEDEDEDENEADAGPNDPKQPAVAAEPPAGEADNAGSDDDAGDAAAAAAGVEKTKKKSKKKKKKEEKSEEAEAAGEGEASTKKKSKKKSSKGSKVAEEEGAASPTGTPDRPSKASSSDSQSPGATQAALSTPAVRQGFLPPI